MSKHSVVLSYGPRSLQRYSSANNHIQVFRTASGYEHSLTPEAKSISYKQESSNAQLPPTSTFSTESFISIDRRSLSDDVYIGSKFNSDDASQRAESDNEGEIIDDDDQTMYSHASILDLDRGADFDLLFSTEDMFPRRASFKRSFRRAEMKSAAQRRNNELNLAVNRQPIVHLSVYDKIVKALSNLFSSDEVARANTLQYINDNSSSGGGSILSGTEREVLNSLVQASSYSGKTSAYLEQSLTPWRSHSFQEDGLRISDNLLISLITGENKLQLVRNQNASTDFIPINLGYAGALLVTVAILAKLRCKPHGKKSSGFIKIKCKDAKINFGISLSGNAPCVLRFQRPGIFSICKIDRYVSLVTRLRDLVDEFVKFVHT